MSVELALLTDGDIYKIGMRAPVYSHASDNALRRYLSGADELPGGAVLLLQLADDADRGVLRARQLSLLSCLDDHDVKAKAALVADMLGCYGGYKDETRDDKRKVVTKFVQELKEVPTWAVARACQAIKTGSAPDISMSRRPTTIEVRHCANTYLTPSRLELRRIAAVLGGKLARPPISEEEAKRVGESMRDLHRKLSDDDKRTEEALLERVSTRMSVQRDREIERDWRHRRQEPMRCGALLISPSLAENIRENRARKIAMGTSKADMGS